MGTNLSGVIDVTSEAARYDASVKEVLADKQVLSHILKYSLEEFEDMELGDIMRTCHWMRLCGAWMSLWYRGFVWSRDRRILTG